MEIRSGRGTTVRGRESTTRRGSTLQIYDLAPGRVSMERDPAFMAERASMGESTDWYGVHQPTQSVGTSAGFSFLVFPSARGYTALCSFRDMQRWVALKELSKIQLTADF